MASSTRDAELAAQARQPLVSAADTENPNDSATAVAPTQAATSEATSETVKPASMTGLFLYATPSERMILVVSLVAAGISSAQTPAMSFFMKDLTECIFSESSERQEKATRIFWIFFGIGAAGWLVTSVAMLGFTLVSDRMALRMRSRFFTHLMSKDVGWYDTHSTAEMSTRLTQDAYDFRQGSGAKFALFFQNALQAPLGIAVAFVRDWRFTLMLIGIVPVMGIVVGGSIKIMTKNLKNQAGYYAKAGGIAETTISSIQTVASFDGYSRELAKYDAQLAVAERDGVKAGTTQGFAAGSNSVVFNGIFALGLWVGSLLMLSTYNDNCWDPKTGSTGGCFNGSTMISVLYAVFTGGFGMTLALQQMGVVATGRVAAARIYKIIDEPPAFDSDVGERLAEVVGNIVFTNVSFSYPSRPDVRALDNISYSVKAGTTAAFVGPSGSGKSTSIGLLMRYYDPASGSVTLDGHDIKILNLNWMRSQFALVQQEPVLFGGTIMSNILYGKEGATPDEARQAAKTANAHDFVSSFPDGYDTVVGERGATLSGGQKQRIAIARAMIRDPKVLLLDEATSALDTESERIVKKALDRILAARSRTTLVIAHRLSTIKDANVIFVLEEGKLVEQGTHVELVNKDGGLYQQLVQLQELTGNDDLDAPQVMRQLSLQRQRTGGSLSLGADTPTAREFVRTLSEKMSQRSDPASPTSLARHNSQQSNADANTALDADAGAEEAKPEKTQKELPAEDEQDRPVPTSRLWELQRKHAGAFFTALIATVPMSAAAPVVGRLFGDSIGILSQLPALPNPETGQWEKAFDEGKIQHAVRTTCLTYGILTVIQFTSVILSVRGFRITSEGITRTIRQETFRAMLRQEMSYFDFRSSGHLTDRLAHEAAMIKSFAGESFGGLIQMIVTLCVAVGLSFFASWTLTVSIVCIMPLLMVGQMFHMKNFRKQDETRAGPVVSEAMGNIRTVAAFGLQRQMKKRYLEVLDVEVKEDARQGKLTAIMQGYQTFVQFLLYGSVLLLSSYYIDHLNLDPANVFRVFFTLVFSMGGVSQGVTQWQGDKAKGAHAVKHIFNTLDRKPLIDAYDRGGLELEEVRGDVSFVHVEFHYPSAPQTQIFTDFHLDVPAGTSAAFVGPSGSGKSTTVRLLQRFYDPINGSVCLDGHDIRSLNLSFLRAQMSLVQQEPVLFAGTIMDNIKYGREGATDEEALKAAKDANAHNFITQFTEKYNTDCGERGLQLSGGQKQRVAIARCMVRQPKVLLLDEATSALDAESERVVQEALDALLAATKRTTLVIAHRLSTIQNSDMICVVYQGTIVEKGTHSELMKITDGQYKRLAARQQLTQ